MSARQFGDVSDRYRGEGVPTRGDAYLTPLNREPIPLIRVSATSVASTSGAVRFIVPLGSQRIVTKVSVQFCPDDPGIDYPNLRIVEQARLWVALRDRNRSGNAGHVLGIFNVFGSRLAPMLIPAPADIPAAGDGLAGHALSFGGPGILLSQIFLAGATTGLMIPTGIFDEAIGELTVEATPTPCPPGVWNLQTRWEPAVGMTAEEWDQIKSLLDPRGNSGIVSTQVIE